MKLHEFIIKLIQTESLDLKTIKHIILDPLTKPELFDCLITNYKLYETLLHIKNEMGINNEGD